MNRIALSTSLSWNHNWDPKYSLDLTREIGVKACQIYLGDNFKEDVNLSTQIESEYSKDLHLIAHSPADLNRKCLDGVTLNTIKKLFNDRESQVVYHHDYKIPIKDTISIIKELNESNITVLLENFYPSTDKRDVKECIRTYKKILIECKLEKCKIFPLVDIPRLFIRGITLNIDSLKETKDILKTIKELNYPLYLHLIDCKSDLQNRESWCPLGEGIIPYGDIFNEIKKLKLVTPLTVLEFENITNVEASIEYLEKRLFNFYIKT